MLYGSTRNAGVSVSSSQAIARGISEDGGLFVPLSIPALRSSDFETLCSLDYAGRAQRILRYFLSDFTVQEIDDCVKGAYQAGKFSSKAVAPLVSLGDNTFMLELWHGPTCAFKDMALQLLPFLLTTAASKVADDKEIAILVATSGDTGKAALEGFKDIPNTKILVFYPQDGVSAMQKLQMTTQEGGNVFVCAIQGNFDDAQTGVKAIFTNRQMANRLSENNMMFSSANSINWGRLVPQIVYYISAYCDLIAKGGIQNGDPVNVVVPTGNFGNILAAYYAYQMGLPVHKFICASNTNHILTDFLKTGTYDRNREFFTTISPSMDILISSNLERLLFDLTGKDDQKIKAWMNELYSTGQYTVDETVKLKLNELFYGGYCDDMQTRSAIKSAYQKYHYLCDTHTAVALKVYEQYKTETGDQTPSIIVSTASPFKFSDSVLEAVSNEQSTNLKDFDKLNTLSRITGVEIPLPLSQLSSKKVRFTSCCTQETMETFVTDSLGI